MCQLFITNALLSLRCACFQLTPTLLPLRLLDLSDLCYPTMAPTVLRHNPDPDETEWVFSIPSSNRRQGMGRHISFSPDQITFDMIRFPQNRILQADDANKFVLVSFANLRFPDKPARLTTEYITRFLTTGLVLNGVRYRFYHHSNSQLVRGPTDISHTKLKTTP